MAGTAQRTLVFGDDHSTFADAAWLWIVNHPWPGWRVEVVHATADLPEEDLVPRAWQPAHPRSLPYPGTTVSHAVIHAEPRRALGSLTDCDLMVIGPRGAGLGKQLGIGSVSAALLRNPPVPLVVVRHADPARRVVVCTDGSGHSLAAVDALLHMPWLGSAHVLVVSVPDPDHEAAATAEAVRHAVEGHAAAVEVRIPEPDPLQVFVRPAEVILEVLREVDADLAVLGTRGLGATASLRAGSIATSLATHAPCSVLLAKAA